MRSLLPASRLTPDECAGSCLCRRREDELEPPATDDASGLDLRSGEKDADLDFDFDFDFDFDRVEGAKVGSELRISLSM